MSGPTTPKNKGDSLFLPPIVQTGDKKARHSIGSTCQKRKSRHLGVESAGRRNSKNNTALSTNYGGSETMDIGSNQYSSKRGSINLDRYLNIAEEDSDHDESPFQTLP